MMTLDAKNLTKVTHNDTVPFAVKLDSCPEPLICSEILRIIPGTRIVCKARLQDRDVIAKFFINSFRAKRQVQREIRGLQFFYAANITAPRIILESSVSNSITVLITEYLHNTSSPHDLLNFECDNKNVTHNILLMFFELLARFHKAGLQQKDLHLNNFLLKDNQLYAIDTADLKQADAPLSPKAAMDNLALFFAQFDQNYYPALMQAFPSYNDSNPSLKIDIPKLLTKAKAKRQKIWRNVAKKCFKNCTNILRKRGLGQLILCKREYYSGQFTSFLNDPDTFIQNTPLLKDGNSSTVSIVEIEGRKYVAKRFNIKNLAKLIGRQFPPYRTRRNWLLSHMLRFNNFQTPKPIAVIEKRFGPFRTRGYMISEFIDAPSVRDSINNSKSEPNKQRDIAKLYVETLNKLHNYKITHGDLKDTNFLYRDGSIYIVDLDSVKFHGTNLTLKRAVKKDVERLKQNFKSNHALLEFVNYKLRNKEPIKLHYSSSKQNWGDQLSPIICKLVSGREVIHAPITDCDMVAIGSILYKAKEHIFAKRIHVWGTGFIEPIKKHKTRHYIHALRGKKSAEILTNVEVKVFGDPGLLCDQLIPEHQNIPKRYELGIIPHYSQRQHPDISAFLKSHPETLFIDIFSEPLQFLQELASCRFILSSSLHGLIAADSLGIPNQRFKLAKDIVGGDFKFEDYYSIFDIPLPQPTHLSEFSLKLLDKIVSNYSRPGLPQIKRSLVDAFPLPGA